MSLLKSALDGESTMRRRARAGHTKRCASRCDEGGDRGETHFVASGDVEGAPRTCAGHDRSLGHDAEGIAAGQRRPFDA